MARRVLITGASGLIGRHVLLQAREQDVAVVDHSRDDLLTPGVAKSAVEREAPDAVLHLAWCASGKAGYRDSEHNLRWVDASLELASACAAAGAAFVGVGTVLDDSPGVDLYSTAKADLRARLASQIESREIGWLRPYYVVDPVLGRPRVVAEALEALREDRPVELSSPSASHDFVHVDDVASAAWAVVEMALAGGAGPVDVGGGRSRSVGELVTRLGARWAMRQHPDEARPAHDASVADLGPLTSAGWTPVATRRFFGDE